MNPNPHRPWLYPATVLTAGLALMPGCGEVPVPPIDAPAFEAEEHAADAEQSDDGVIWLRTRDIEPSLPEDRPDDITIDLPETPSGIPGPTPIAVIDGAD